MKTFFLFLIFSVLSAGVMLSGISMKNSTMSGAIMLALCLGFAGYIWRKSKASRRRF
ncbi:hypothetical protein [Pedobacter sp. KBS0701]|uniref:hypothetical protein n=1 Tax=Pedobacter sp. KBS0701 TaxID=2578106 RepID=UPI00143DCA7D|nr:hypothetical protein [Pedobacter sp. KBS0701]